MALTSEDCVSDVAFHASPAVARVSGSVDQINLRGNLTGSGWTISLRQEKLLDSENADLVFPLCRDGKTLSLGLAPSLFP
jgi:hypothetical protein